VLLFDSETRGFGVRVTAKGTKTFLAQYTIATRRRRAVLGTFGTLTVEQARTAAKALLGRVAHGADPFADRQVKADAARAANAEAQYTFGKLIEAWVAAREGDRRPSYLREAKACLVRNLSDWQDRAANSITTTDAVRALDDVKMTKGIVAANRSLAYASAAYGWAVRRQRLVTNPMRGIERPGREQARERVLTAGELGAIWRGCNTLSASFAGFVRVLMLTLARRDEVSSMRWVELNNPSDPTVWTLPRERAKNGRAHVVPLPEPVREIIRNMPIIGGNPFVFAGQGKKAIAAFGYAKNEIITAMEEVEGILPNWRFHDFRRSGVTALAGMGFPPHVCDRLLNHITGAIQGVAAVYQRAEFMAERKAALDAWAALVIAAVEQCKGSDNVVRLQRTG
jgi:integrase